MSKLKDYPGNGNFSTNRRWHVAYSNNFCRLFHVTFFWIFISFKLSDRFQLFICSKMTTIFFFIHIENYLQYIDFKNLLTMPVPIVSTKKGYFFITIKATWSLSSLEGNIVSNLIAEQRSRVNSFRPLLDNFPAFNSLATVAEN